MRCIPHGRWGLAQCKSTWEQHAGSDKSFENITLCLDQLPLKIQFTKEKRTLKPWFWVEKRTRYLNVNRAAKNKPVLTKFEHKTLFFKAAALNGIYKANQSTELPFQTRNRIKACSPVRSSWTKNEQLHTESPNFGPRVVNTRPWRHYPDMGSYLHPNMVKNANFRGLHRIWEFLPTLRSVIILRPSQPRLLARLPRWQLWWWLLL